MKVVVALLFALTWSASTNEALGNDDEIRFIRALEKFAESDKLECRETFGSTTKTYTHVKIELTGTMPEFNLSYTFRYAGGAETIRFPVSLARNYPVPEGVKITEYPDGREVYELSYAAGSHFYFIGISSGGRYSEGFNFSNFNKSIHCKIP